MLIQNISNMTQAPQPARLANDRFTGNGEPAVVAANTQATLQATSAELPQIAAKQVAHQPAAAELQSSVDNINKALRQADKNLVFSIDEASNKTIIKVVDSVTGDVIREIPSKEALAISQAIEQIQQGLLLKQKA
jgi:flagellar protein FlaG